MRRRVWVLATVVALLAGASVMGVGEDGGLGRIAYTLPAIADIVEVKIERGDRALVLRQIEGQWSIAPGGHALDEQAHRDLIDTLSTPVVMDQALEVGESTPARLGLGPAATQVSLKSKTGVTRFRVGKLVDGRHTFIAPLGETVSYRARANLPGVFQRPLNLWRNRQLFDRKYADMAAVERRQGARVIWRAERADPTSPWRLVRPEGMNVGQREVDAVANTLGTLRADGFLGNIGDHAPSYTIMGESFDGARFGVALEPTRGPLIRGRSTPGDTFVSLPRSRVLFLDAQVSDLRNRRLFDLSPDGIRELVIPRTPALHLKRTHDGVWNLVTAGRETPADETRARDFVAWVAQLRTAGFPAVIPESAFAETAEAAVIRDDRDRQTTLFLGAEYRNGARFVRTSARPDEVYILSPSTLERLGASPDDFIAAP